MTTEVIITGTGMPMVQPGRSGPGVLVRYGDIALQFDAGRNTLVRLLEAGTHVSELSAIFLTHYHSDHVVGLQDVVLSRWVYDFESTYDSFDLVAPNGATVQYCERMLDAWDNDLEVRAQHGASRSTDQQFNLIGFDVPDAPVEVWSHGDVRVLAGQVRHEPVVGAVGYRIETPDGVVVISGDTVVCPEMAELAAGADVVVYEAMLTDVVQTKFPPSMRYIVEYHADTQEIGEQMAALKIPTLMLTHLIPQPDSPEVSQQFEDQTRAGGYQGTVMVCNDLDRVVLG